MSYDLFSGSIIAEALKKIAPSLDLNGYDIRILRLCMQDFENYYNWIKNHDAELATLNLKSEHDDPNEIIDFIEVWVGIWWVKYNERVKLIFEKPRGNPLSKVANDNLGRFTMKEQMDIVSMISDEFIKNGEICAPKVLADMAFRQVLGRYGPKKYWSKEDKINLLSTLRREARNMSKTHGPLLFMMVTKNYFKLREFRDDGVAQGL